MNRIFHQAKNPSVKPVGFLLLGSGRPLFNLGLYRANLRLVTAQRLLHWGYGQNVTSNEMS